ncbi:20692_t:CDS:2 [Gigaspora margarita]|uniref:20692_t:CDS:1 n=1 Tax=Gigaspora margarita TaxID=4874 RepID=A0ABN7VZH9_GIGMA|nr:20692_t:CDS:2 [Gigaspora margarita]
MFRPEHNINKRIARTGGHNILDRVIDAKNPYDSCRVRITLQELLEPGGSRSTYHQYCLHASHAQGTNFDKYNYSRGKPYEDGTAICFSCMKLMHVNVNLDSKASQFDLMKDHYDHECSNFRTNFGLPLLIENIKNIIFWMIELVRKKIYGYPDKDILLTIIIWLRVMRHEKYYKLRKLDEIIPSKKQNLFAPRHPFRLLVAGTSESEKTSMVVHLLLGSKYPKIYPWMSGEKRGHKMLKGISKNFGERYILCDDLIVVAQHQDEELWKILIVPEKLPNISSFKRTGRFTVIVFDDLAGEPLATQLKIVSFFRSGKHNGISSIYIAQHFYETHPNIRANLKYISLHRGCGTLDSIKQILKDTHDDYEPLAKKIYEVIKKHFVVIDIRRPANDPLSIRYRWNKPLLKKVKK